eukprot:CAMPEP_0169134360 /NCGR_PEP_ID=MMETSP1015-20121227/39832_1 /TAXON_ID=342587 /ORGANISM="Karlodinium micrum, Strain CCMP2283" /LENGTH=277 /DNA_ID=CAMNT_0009198869 /DNA_START=54 /DNA_END=887 /DNA_ORIENTATION=-
MAPKPNRVALAVEDSPDSKDCLILAIPAKQISRAPTWKKRILDTIGDRPLEDVVEEVKKQRLVAESEIAQAVENEQQKIKESDAVMQELKSSSDEVDVAISEELDAAKAYTKLLMARKEKSRIVEAARADLYEAQKKLSMLEVLAAGQAKMKELESTRIEARRAAEDAKKMMLEHRLQQKQVSKALRQALVDLEHIDTEEKPSEAENAVVTSMTVGLTTGAADSLKDAQVSEKEGDVDLSQSSKQKEDSPATSTDDAKIESEPSTTIASLPNDSEAD